MNVPDNFNPSLESEKVRCALYKWSQQEYDCKQESTGMYSITDCTIPPMPGDNFLAFPQSGRELCVSKDVFRHKYDNPVNEMIIDPCLHTKYNNSWECGEQKCCSRSHQSFDNVTRNKQVVVRR
jgi:hypothetical protein